MRYPKLYTSLEEFERMELRSGNVEWSSVEFFDDVLDDNLWREDDEEEEDEY